MDAEDIGDIDPLAPGPDIDERHDSDTDDVEDMHEEQGGDDTPADWSVMGDGSASDSQGIVRVWVEENRITKVRVSPRWHSRLQRRTLDDCFMQALMNANLHVASVEPPEVRTYDDADFSGLPPFSQRSFAAFQHAFDDVERRWDEALERREEKVPLPRPATTGKSKGVTVSLTDDGIANAVTFDTKWLDTAQAGDICTHVVRAAENAYARFIPAEEDRSEIDEVEAEHEVLLAAFKAMLNPKEQS